MEQMMLGQFAAPTKSKRPKQEKRCENCRYCAALAKPYERSDGSIIYGYCFGDGDKDYPPIWARGGRFGCRWTAAQMDDARGTSSELSGFCRIFRPGARRWTNVRRGYFEANRVL